MPHCRKPPPSRQWHLTQKTRRPGGRRGVRRTNQKNGEGLFVPGVLILLVADGTAQQTADHGTNSCAFGSVPAFIMANNGPGKTAQHRARGGTSLSVITGTHTPDRTQHQSRHEKHQREFIFHDFNQFNGLDTGTLLRTRTN
jgi:hypothetical protein